MDQIVVINIAQAGTEGDAEIIRVDLVEDQRDNRGQHYDHHHGYGIDIAISETLPDDIESHDEEDQAADVKELIDKVQVSPDIFPAFVKVKNPAERSRYDLCQYIEKEEFSDSPGFPPHPQRAGKKDRQHGREGELYDGDDRQGNDKSSTPGIKMNGGKFRGRAQHNRRKGCHIPSFFRPCESRIMDDMDYHRHHHQLSQQDDA